MTWLWIILGILIIMLGAIGALILLRPRFLTCGPRGDIGATLFWHLNRLFVRVVHRARYIGLEHVPMRNDAGPFIVVSNHTGGVDPILIQTACPFLIRWMMASDTMSPNFNWFWKWMEIIPVERTGRDSGPAREAIRHLRAGRSVGIFPEGGIANPPGEIRPFMDGVGLIIAKSNAPVLLVWVSGTRFTDSPFGSVFKPGRARIELLGTFEFTDEEKAKPRELVERLRRMIAQRSGWPLNDQILPTARRASAETADH